MKQELLDKIDHLHPDHRFGPPAQEQPQVISIPTVTLTPESKKRLQEAEKQALVEEQAKNTPVQKHFSFFRKHGSYTEIPDSNPPARRKCTII